MSLHNPINGSKEVITKVLLERNTTPEHLQDATLLDYNEYYRIYSNGLLVKIDKPEDTYERTGIAGYSPYPDPPFQIPKLK